MNSAESTPAIYRIIEDFELLEEWEDRYRYVIDLGRDLGAFPEAARTAQNKVQGCVSQVWLDTQIGAGSDPIMVYEGDSDAHIVRGLVAIMIALYSGRRASEIASTDAGALLKRLGLDEHLSPQRSNGLRAMVQRIRRDAAAALGS